MSSVDTFPYVVSCISEAQQVRSYQSMPSKCSALHWTLRISAMTRYSLSSNQLGSCMGSSLSNHSMIPMLYFVLIPILDRKSVPKMTSYLHHPSKTSAFCCSTTWFLPSSGNLTCLMITICYVEQVPARVWILHLMMIAQDLQCLGRHLSLIKTDVDHGSKRTFSSVCNLTEEIVSTTVMVVGVKHLLFGSLTSGDLITSPIFWSSLTNG